MLNRDYYFFMKKNKNNLLIKRCGKRFFIVTRNEKSNIIPYLLED